MKMALGGLPLIDNMLGKTLNPSENSQDSENAEHKSPHYEPIAVTRAIAQTEFFYQVQGLQRSLLVHQTPFLPPTRLIELYITATAKTVAVFSIGRRTSDFRY
jgi:hypothetical protein